MEEDLLHCFDRWQNRQQCIVAERENTEADDPRCQDSWHSHMPHNKMVYAIFWNLLLLYHIKGEKIWHVFVYHKKNFLTFITCSCFSFTSAWKLQNRLSVTFISVSLQCKFQFYSIHCWQKRRIDMTVMEKTQVSS